MYGDRYISDANILQTFNLVYMRTVLRTGFTWFHLSDSVISTWLIDFVRDIYCRWMRPLGMYNRFECALIKAVIRFHFTVRFSKKYFVSVVDRIDAYVLGEKAISRRCFAVHDSEQTSNSTAVPTTRRPAIHTRGFKPDNFIKQLNRTTQQPCISSPSSY